jgi:hypothetical protein
VGHLHHRWICTLEEDELVFLPKWHSLHSNWRVRVPRRWADQLAYQERALAHFWEGELPAREQVALTLEDYPYDEFERAIRERFRPSAAELRLKELRERARATAGRAGAPVRRAAGRVLNRARR